MERKYRTSHQGIAAYLVMKGYDIVRLENGTNRQGKPTLYIELDVDPTTGRQLGDEFFNGTVSGNLKNFYDAQGKVRHAIWEFRQ